MDAIRWFNRWLRHPISADGDLPVEGVLDLLNAHEMAQDPSAQDYIVPPRRYRERPGRFRIYGENQDNWYCFVAEGAEALLDPPVYFETHPDLINEYDVDPEDVADGTVPIGSGFKAFLWYILANQICVRMRSSGYFANGVCGVRFPYLKGIELDADEAGLRDPLSRPFPGWGACLIGDEVICIREWGAAFLNPASRDAFVKRHAPEIEGSWP